MQTIQLGCLTYTATQAIAIMQQSARQDKTYSLAQQLIAAKLNVTCRNSNTSCVSSLISTADTWLCAHPIGSGIGGGSAAWRQINATNDALDRYNNGLLCAPHCSETFRSSLAVERAADKSE